MTLLPKPTTGPTKLATFALLAPLLGSLGACGLLGPDLRKSPFSHDASPTTSTLVLIGGNSECTGDKGIWRLRDTIADDVARGLGFQNKSAITLRYFGWTGDLPGKGSCLPDHWSYRHGEDAILASLRQDRVLETSRSLVVVGWSNGGATADQLAALISADTQLRPVDLLVTLDPVSFFSGWKDAGRTATWQNVYIRSVDFWTRFSDPGDFFAGIGGAWNDFGPGSPPCIRANLGDVWKMWNEVLRGEKFGAWVDRNRRVAPSASVPALHTNPDNDAVDAGSTPCQ